MKAAAFGLSVLAVVFGSSAQAQIATDGSVGAKVDLPGLHVEIPDTLGTTKGGNLFHSFEKFNVASKGSATFTQTLSESIDNVISRVTGGKVSNIDGLLESQIPNADFWFINPAGVMFGPNASINVPAAFHVSTADRIGFGDGKFFSALDTEGSVLSVAAPEAFGFLGPTGGIAIENASLNFTEGTNVSLVGGDIAMTESTLTVPAGQTRIIGVASAGDIKLLENGADVSGVGSLAEVRMVDSQVNTKGDGGGRIFIRGSNLVVDGHPADDIETINAGNTGNTDAPTPAIDISATGDVTITGAEVASSAFGEGAAGDIVIKAESITLQSDDEADIFTNIGSRSQRGASGDGGDILLDAKEIMFGDRTLVETATRSGSSGDGGSVIVEVAGGNLLFEGDSGLFASALGQGNGGDIVVNAAGGQVKLSTGARIKAVASIESGSTSSGHSGNILVDADTVILDGGDAQNFVTGILSGTVFPATGDAGSVTVNARELQILNGAEVSSFTQSASDGGNVFVNADEVTVSGFRFPGFVYSSGIYSSVTGSSGTGDGGTAFVVADKIMLSQGGIIASANFAAGNAGSLDIDAGSISIDFGAISSATLGAVGEGGSVLIDAGDLSIDNGGFIAASSQGDGRGGDIFANARDVRVLEGSFISATALGTGEAGNVTIEAESVLVSGFGQALFQGFPYASLIVSETGVAARGGGDITIAAASLRLKDSGQVTTRTVGDAPAGNIDVIVGTLDIAGENPQFREFIAGVGLESLLETASGIDASSLPVGVGSDALGSAGTIRVRAGDVSISDRGFINSRTQTAGQGGSIDIKANAIEIVRGGTISTRSSGSGRAGIVSISGADELVMRNGSITTEALQANGGQIDIRVRDLIHMKDSVIATAVGGGEGDAGNIFIDPRFMIMDNSRIVADAFGGAGGNITIIAGHLFRSQDSLISATSQQNVSGTITVNASENDVSSEIVLAEPGYLDPTSLLAESCEARSGRTRSSLVRAGRGGLPDDPGRTLHATLVADQMPEDLETEGAPEGEGTDFAFLDSASFSTHAEMRTGACRQ